MFESLKSKLDRLYNNIIGKVKSIDFTRQSLHGVKNPERIHALATAPEYKQVDSFSLECARQLPPTTAESVDDSDIGSLEEWGFLILKRNRFPGETPEQYRDEVLKAWRPFARGGNRADLLFWSLMVSGVRKVYPYVGSLDVNTVTITDIEGRLDGAFLYVRSSAGNGEPTSTELDGVMAIIDTEGTIATGKISVVPIILREYDFEIDIEPSILGGSSSLAEVQTKINDIVYKILNDTEPFIKYVDEIRRDIVVSGQYLQQIRNVITKPPYRYIINDLIIYQNGVDVITDQLPQGNIPIMGTINFV